MNPNLFSTRLVLITSLALVILSTSLLAQDQDTLYVTDRLRLSLYESSNDRSPVLKLLVSGDVLKVAEVSGLYARVTTVDGTRGWVKRGFLVDEPTSNLQLADERAKNEALQEEVERLGDAKQVIDQYDQDMNVLNDKNTTLEQEKSTLQTRIDELVQEVDDKQSEIDALKDNNGIDPQLLVEIAKQYWPLLVAALLVLVILVFLLSKAIIETRIKSRFQGVKVW